MSKHYVFLSFVSVALILLLTRCDASLLASDTDGHGGLLTPVEATSRNQPVPLTGHCETTFAPHPTQPGPPVVRQIDQGTCQISHLGEAFFYSDKEINFATGTQVTTEASFTAANGDVLYATGSGTSAPSAPGRIGFSATLTLLRRNRSLSARDRRGTCRR
jgi:hypothetical protein